MNAELSKMDADLTITTVFGTETVFVLSTLTIPLYSAAILRDDVPAATKFGLVTSSPVVPSI